MPSESSILTTDQVEPTIPSARRPLPDDARGRAAAKGAATVRRRREERRAEKLAHIREQITNGTLVVRYMTIAQRNAASKAARPKRTPNGAGPS